MTASDEQRAMPDAWFVVGDVHLHRHADSRVAEDLELFVREVTRTDPRALIVFNGDTFDLDRVRGEPRGGLGPAQAARRLRAVVDAFPSLFDAMSSHLDRGGEIVFVAGNHDAELLFDVVGDVLVERLGSSARTRVVERFRRGPCVVEHGHQVDPDAAFHPDPKTALAKLRLSAFPLASLITRTLLSYIPRFELAGDNHTVPVRVLARVVRDYKLAAVEMIARFPLAGLRIVWHALMARLRGDVQSKEASMSSPWRVARRLYLDRYFGVAFGLPLAFALLAGLAPSWMIWPLGLVAVCLAVPPARRNQFAHRDVRRCALLAEQLAAQGNKLVVLGHTHRAFVDSRDDGTTYANHGAFSVLVRNGAGFERTFLRVDSCGRCTLQRIVRAQRC